MDFSKVVESYKSVVDSYKAWGAKRAERAERASDLAEAELVFFKGMEQIFMGKDQNSLYVNKARKWICPLGNYSDEVSKV